MVVMVAVAVLEDVMLAVVVLDVLVEVLRFVTGSKLRISTYINGEQLRQPCAMGQDLRESSVGHCPMQ